MLCTGVQVKRFTAVMAYCRIGDERSCLKPACAAECGVPERLWEPGDAREEATSNAAARRTCPWREAARRESGPAAIPA